MKSVLLIQYSQRGQRTDVARSLVGPLLEAPEIDVAIETLRPTIPFPYPWPFQQFFDTFPEAMYLDPPAMEPITIGPARFDPVFEHPPVPVRFMLAPAIRAAIRLTTRMMLYTPVPLVGIRGIRLVSRKIRRLNARDHAGKKLLFGHMVRLQEEIGTSAAGFRFLYAAFLQEAAVVVDEPVLGDVARQLTSVSDEWRQFALLCARMCKGREEMDYERLADMLMRSAELEHDVYQQLRRDVRS